MGLEAEGCPHSWCRASSGKDPSVRSLSVCLSLCVCVSLSLCMCTAYECVVNISMCLLGCLPVMHPDANR